ncbi:MULTISPECIES: sn-glycerol-3-phosphate ABC transporter ATP-binding protein UgpC [unclassified Chelatococcus]|uniref:ABC transporter ATP-binding protein n=1 Tax=unclassified Chelatococcus TaxID=2638111 RepID=UPI001BCD8824|nr:MULTISPECIES: sn-glycerol-3-phosphate ABC transporter ATP-binding protein UgpC [unclassified Chelatococcus]CAH1655361.1 sn-glycerol-3-phosphate import ATP-binding protein UgpC 2 [Hyphomicrobiales bacterium]MBS7742621.1 sn-glycerol-3-phosphate ABC transporter ATP-binding protein UgpC [Chelatococcus sp. HY11]MBX3542261.1 sn-glycerol-3-phosphate ABC transporter ATP-binding protein UgpC [Chelatococcus sp.]MCO5075521.1 sn-glycerol-3-phosphate ABC transporter ATP-binding protein UgpC [Chelatococcu
MAQLSIRDIRKSYDRKQVLHGINLDFASREFIVIVGPSGCGKSTLLRMIAGLEDITSGEIAMDGKRLNDIEPAQRGCSMMFQNYALYPHMTVAQNIGYPLKIAGVSKPERAKRVLSAAKMLGLEDYLDRRPAQLSGGQRQRVAMGRAVVREPKVFLFDEPLSNLDAQLRVQMRIELRRLHKRLGATSILVTHDQTEAMTLADRLVVMKGGRVEQSGRPADIYADPATEFVAGFLGAPAMNILKARIIEPGKAGLDLSDLEAIDIPPAALPIGSAVKVGFRPESLRIAAIDQPGLSATVDLIEELGGTRIAYCRLGEAELAVVLPSTSTLAENVAVRLQIDPDAVLLFDVETGRRIRAEACVRREPALQD